MLDNGVQTLIHLRQLRKNINLLARSADSLLPIIKSDAYGHGVIHVARTLVNEGIRQVAIGSVGEGFRIRQAGLNVDIVALMGALNNEDVRKAASLKIMPLLHSFEECLRFEALHQDIDVVIKCETGMGRLGLTFEQIPALMERLKNAPYIHPKILLSHLACADADDMDSITISQMLEFEKIYELVRKSYPHIRPSLLNSPGMMICPVIASSNPILNKADFRKELARPGIALYGINPLAGTRRENLGEGLSPVMEAKTQVIAVHPVKKGQSLSYGHTFTANHDMMIAIIAAGYADGYPRSLSNKGFVAFHGGRAKIVARVCMQMTFVDVTHLPGVKTDDPVWLLGGPNDGSTQPISAVELARWADVIPYEILCSLGKNERLFIE